jgi:hypothetical protein
MVDKSLRMQLHHSRRFEHLPGSKQIIDLLVADARKPFGRLEVAVSESMRDKGFRHCRIDPYQDLVAA